MPSTTSRVVSIDLASSTVIVPSLPTLSIASAMISPIVVSQLAETVATCAISVRSETFLEIFANSATTASTAFWMPRCSEVGFAPAVTFRNPSRKMDSARTVAVVVPSPATSEVLEATSRTSCAPIFSYGSSSSISLATVTPSLVIVGLPNFLSRITLRPEGPSVALTALASFSTPRKSACRAPSSNCNCFAAIIYPNVLVKQLSLSNDAENVVLTHDEIVVAVDLDFGAPVFGDEDFVADFHGELDLLAIVVELPSADRRDGTFLRLLSRRVGNDDAALFDFLLFERLDQHPI